VKVLRFFLLAVCCMFPIVLSGCENTNISSLSTPENLIVKNGIISFKQVQDADFYSISINDKVFSVNAKHNSNVNIVDNIINYDANKLLTYGKTYSIKIKARGNEKYDSHYTAVFEYLHNIDLLIPENVTISANTLVWDNVNNATYYIVKAFYKTGNRTQEFRCDLNTCEISGFLANNGSGEYQFSVKAVREGTSAAESIFSDVVNYSNFQQLSTPLIKSVVLSGNNLVMTALVDANANKLTLNCGSDFRNVMLNGTSQYISKSGNDLIINLTGIFGVDQFENLTNYVFTLQAKLETSAPSYFTNSQISEQYTFNKTQTLTTPTLSIIFDAQLNKYVVSWLAVENAAGYEVVINGGEPIFVENSKTEFLLDSSFSSIKVRAIGVGNYLNSNYSNTLTK